MTHHESIVPDELEGVRADVYAAQIASVTRSRAASLIEDERVTVDGRPLAKAGQKLRAGQLVRVNIPPLKPAALTPEDVPVDVLYEDTDVLVLNKPAGVVVHPSAGHDTGTLVHALLAHCADLSGIGGEERPGIVHRLDKDTSGTLIIAKNDFAHQKLAADFKEHNVKRVYIAIVHGAPKEDVGTVDLPIARHPVERKRMAIVKGGRRAVTDYRVIERGKTASLVECTLHTGRTHQIRVHMAHLGHPVIGDAVYGWASDRKMTQGQLLHAHTIGFHHPRTGEWIELTAPLPERMIREMARLKT